MWFYLLPEPLLGVLIVAAFLAFGLGGLIATRRRIRREPEAHNELVGYVFAVIGAVYAVLLALSAVAVWEAYRDAELVVAREANAVADLYRNLEGYPQPEQTALRSYLRDYTRTVLDQEWPAMRFGRVPDANDVLLDRMVAAWAAFEPRTEGQKLLHAQTLQQLDAFLDDRRDRTEAVKSGIKPVMWVVLIIGATVTIGFLFLFQTDRLFSHLVMTGALSVLIGLVVFWIVAMDRPFMGNDRVGAHRFATVLQGMDRISLPLPK